jgi:hypothetical protein
MYSVLRFISDEDAMLRRLGSEIDGIDKSAYTGIDKVGGRFSVSISEVCNSREHILEIRSAIKRFSPVIQSAKSLGVRIEVDVAVYTDDLDGQLYTEMILDQSMLALLSEMNVQLRVTFYGVA